MSVHVIEDNITSTRISLHNEALMLDTRDIAGCYWHTQLTLASGVQFSDVVSQLTIGREYTVGTVTNLVFADHYPVSNTLTFISNKRYGAKDDTADLYTDFDTNNTARITDITSDTAVVTGVSTHFGALYSNASPSDYNSITVTELSTYNADGGTVSFVYNGAAADTVVFAGINGTNTLFNGNQPKAVTPPIFGSSSVTTHTTGHVIISIPNPGTDGVIELELKKNSGFGTINIDRQHSNKGL